MEGSLTDVIQNNREGKTGQPLLVTVIPGSDTWPNPKPDVYLTKIEDLYYELMGFTSNKSRVVLQCKNFYNHTIKCQYQCVIKRVEDTDSSDEDFMDVDDDNKAFDQNTTVETSDDESTGPQNRPHEQHGRIPRLNDSSDSNESDQTMNQTLDRTFVPPNSDERSRKDYWTENWEVEDNPMENWRGPNWTHMHTCSGCRITLEKGYMNATRRNGQKRNYSDHPSRRFIENNLNLFYIRPLGILKVSKTINI